MTESFKYIYNVLIWKYFLDHKCHEFEETVIANP